MQGWKYPNFTNLYFLDWKITALQNECHVSFGLSNWFPFLPEMDLAAADCSSSKRECHRENSCQYPCKFGADTYSLEDWPLLKPDGTLSRLSIVFLPPLRTKQNRSHPSCVILTMMKTLDMIIDRHYLVSHRTMEVLSNK